MAVTVRAAREEDAAGIAAVLNPIIEAGVYTVMDAPITVEEQAAFIREFPAAGVYNVAVSRENGRVLGLQDVFPRPAPFAHLGEISTFVALGAHGSGIGRALSLATFRRARESGFHKLCASIRADNPGAVAFYRRQGFRVIGTAREHARVGERYVDEVLAERILGAV